MNLFLSLIAQTQGAQPGPNPLGFLLPATLGAMVVFMLLSSRSQKKREKREREEMFDRLSRNDRVQTIGGVIGTLISVKEDEVVLKVDESTNTKMTFTKTAVQRILSDDPSGAAGRK